ncbi:MAG: DUF3472 domain-containing protein [Chitinophagaceae bacterium]
MAKAILPLLLLLTVIFSYRSRSVQKETARPAESSIVIPMGGNSWVIPRDDQKMLNEKGITHWKEEKFTVKVFVRLGNSGSLHIYLNARTDKEAVLGVTIAGVEKQVKISASDFALADAGNWHIRDTGYLPIIIRGISKQGNFFADISEIRAGGSATKNAAYVKNNEGNYFYWGRRGPSVHLNYPLPANTDAEWFYNEVTVPAGQDVIGSYFMADGFAEGYFGMQVNSEKERRVLFSLWSPFKTDNPGSIPDSMKITLLKKGESVYSGEFGNEGSGGQSFLRYNWKADEVYKFLLHALPDEDRMTTTYTAYIFAPELNKWKLIASFKRPQTNTYLKRLHSFLENFIPEQGDKERRVLFGNQWIKTSAGRWTELIHADFTFDNTALKGYRMDYAGGLENNMFFLKNCGFFNKYTAYKTGFERRRTNNPPLISLEALP